MKTLSPSTGPVAPLSVAARLVAIITLFFPCTAVVAEDLGTPLLKGSKLYIEEIEGGLDQFMTAEIVAGKRKLPFTLVATATGAGYFLNGTFLAVPDEDGSSHTGYAAVRLIDAEGTIIWAASAMASSDAGTGVMAVARELVKKLEEWTKRD